MKIVVIAAIILTVGLDAAAQKTQPDLKIQKMETSNKQKAVAFTKAFENGALNLLGYLHPTKYTEHDVNAFDGVAGFEGLLNILPKDAPKPNIVRAIEDGDFVFTHVEYNFFGPQIAIDIFRFEDGLIAEHWDNIQEFAQPNPSGRTMIDGATEIGDLDKTNENKALARSFVDDVLVGGNFEKLTGYFNGDSYIQHSPSVPDQLSGFETVLAKWKEQATRYETIHRVLGEGNFVLVVSEGYLGGKHYSFYDLFRIEDGKIAEHWDIVQEIPAKENWKNENGKF